MKKLLLDKNRLTIIKEKVTDLTPEDMDKLKGGYIANDTYKSCYACFSYVCSNTCTDESCSPCIPLSWLITYTG